MIVSDVAISRAPGNDDLRVVNIVYWCLESKEHKVKRVLTISLQRALAWVTENSK